MKNPDSDVNANNSDSNNNNSSISVNNYFDNNKFRNSRLDEPILENDGEEEEQLDGEESGSGVLDPDYSDYEENIEEFVDSSSPSDGHVSVNSATVSPVNTDLSFVSSPISIEGSGDESNSTVVEALPKVEELVQPDQIRNVVDEATSGAIATATENLGEEMSSDGPRTEALIGIRPFSEEGSGNGNGRVDDDEEDDDYDDDDTDAMKARKRVKNARENQEKGNSRRFNNFNGNLEDESDEEDEGRFMKNRRFGKNNAIKFISTPHGKVGILYSSSNDEKKSNGGGSSSGSNGGGSRSSSDIPKDAFRGISSDLRPILISNSDSRSNEDRNGGSSGSGGKMTPVLTADGKVALLYRGASAENENVAKKYEPIVNYTKTVEAPVESQDTNLEKVEEATEKENKELFPIRTNFNHDFDLRPRGELPVDGQPLPERTNSIGGERGRSDDFDQDDSRVVPAPPPPPKMEDNNFLPILDRPLSELLGLKKHQFTHFRVTEPAPTTPIPQVNMRGKMPANYDYDFNGDYNGVSDQEILTKTEVVNLAIVPSLTQEHNSVVHHKGHEHPRKHRKLRLEDLSNIHCAMQAMVGVAALACIFGMLGAYFKNRILDTQVPAYRL